MTIYVYTDLFLDSLLCFIDSYVYLHINNYTFNYHMFGISLMSFR